MSEIIESKTYVKRSHPFAYVTCTNFEKGKGMIQIYSDWGIYQSVWMGMGDKTIEQFVLSCDDGYLKDNFKYQMNYMGVKKKEMGRLDKFFETSWNDIKEILKGK